MGIFDPSVRKRLLKTLNDAKKDADEAARDLQKLYDTKAERCEAYLKAKEKYEDYLKKTFGGVDQYKKFTDETSALSWSKQQEKDVDKARDLWIKLTQAELDANEELIANALDRYKSRIADVQAAKKTLEDYLDKKAELKSKGDKKEYDAWKKALRARLFPAW